MICWSCGGAAAGDGAARCPICGGPPLLDGRYRLEAVLGQGATGITYRARRLADGALLCLKELRYSRLGSFEAEKLFRREAEVLRQLAHPGIPRHVECFATGTGKAFALCLVQELVEGHTLQAELQQHRYREDEVLDILAELLGILAYLHTLSPPVVHRDIKPANVMRRAGDGRLVLIDFGSVRDALREPAGGSTVTGTFGYMAPEQYYGRATPATDLYALGVLAVVLLTRRPPEELVDDANRLDWQPHVRLHPATRHLLESLLEPEPARRLGEASRALALAQAARAEVRAELAAALPAPPLEARTPEQAGPAAPPAPVESAAPVEAPASPQAAPPAAAWPVPAPPEPPELPASPDPGRRVSSGLIVIGALLLAVLGLSYLLGPGLAGSGAGVQVSSVPAEPALATGCQDSTCQPVPRGLKGLSFGMTLEEAKEALPELQEAIETKPEIVQPPPDPRALGDFGSLAVEASQAMPGRRLTVRTTFHEQPARCTLAFAVNDRLSQMVCALDRQPDLKAHLALEQAIRNRLVEKHGPPRSTTGEPRTESERHRPFTGLVQTYARSWTWRDEGAELVLRSEYSSFPGHGKQLELTDTASEHEQLLQSIKSQVERRFTAAREAQQRKQEEARRLEQQRLERATKRDF